MMNKIFVFWGLALSAILIIENLVNSMPAYVFIDSSSNNAFLSFISIIIWIFIWYGIKWFLEKDNWDNDNYDF